ncbi:MAG: transcriptional regulator NrdR [Xanthomonadaceae bacterium]|nr:transcriptional regulator NrdR [Xanthomonadaceae bacterium]
MKCPFCQTTDTKVIDSRFNPTGEITRRRRECPSCSGRFTTYERIEELMPAIVKKDGRREGYNRDKILSGIVKSCQKRPVTQEQIEACVDGIEKQIRIMGIKELPSRTIGEMTMNTLHALDPVAYVRFAAVYREFTDVKEFFNELNENRPELKPTSGQTMELPLFD